VILVVEIQVALGEGCRIIREQLAEAELGLIEELIAPCCQCLTALKHGQGLL
jgi:hypothetical protein